MNGTYRITWVSLLEAPSSEEAAREAQALLRNPLNAVSTFVVRDVATGVEEVIDLDELAADERTLSDDAARSPSDRI